MIFHNEIKNNKIIKLFYFKIYYNCIDLIIIIEYILLLNKFKVSYQLISN